jgi:hypothetical protein
MGAKFRGGLPMVLGIGMFALSAWFTFGGLYSNLLRARSALFSLSPIAFCIMVFGFVGALSCIAILRYPRPAGIVASLTMLAIVAVQLSQMIAVYRLEFLMNILVTIVLPLLFATAGLLVFAVIPESRDHRQ